MSKKKLFLILFLCFLWGQSFSQEKIAVLEFKGNKSISSQRLLSEIKTRRGQIFNSQLINEDIKRLYSTGLFENVKVEVKDTPAGKRVIFILKEKPLIEGVEFKGLKFIRPKVIRSKIQTKRGKLLEYQDLYEDTKTIKALLEKRGFSQAEVNYRLEKNEEKNTVRVIFLIEEKKKLRIKKIEIKGNEKFSKRRILSLMKTKPASIFRVGFFREEVLKEDIERIKSFYKSKGFNEIEVNCSYHIEKNKVFIALTLKEGRRYTIGKIKVEGNSNIPLEEILKVVKIKPGDIYIESKIREDILNIQRLYAERGFIFAQVEDVSVLNPTTRKIDVCFKIKEGEVYYVNRIEIKGNIKTRDNVIRRNLKIKPGDKVETKKLRLSAQRLKNLGIFEEVSFDYKLTSEPDKIDLIVNVKEAKTGYFSFGGGYSSTEKFVGFIELSQLNFDWKNPPTFLGGAQKFSVRGEFGTSKEFIDLSFTNPQIFDKFLLFGFDFYKRKYLRETDIGYGYDENKKGGAIRFGYEFTDFFKAKVGFRCEKIEISNIPETATQELKKEEGKKTSAKLEYAFIYDTRDNFFSPSKGLQFRLNLDHSAKFLGSDEEFVKLFVDNSFYIGFFKNSVLELRTRLGVAIPYGDSKDIPIFDRFFAGGAYTIRGYHERKIGPIDSITEDPIGGESLLVFNAEYTYSLTDFLKVAIFFDTGNVWAEYQDLGEGNFKSAVGLGIRVKTPLGPIRLDYGYPLDLESGEHKKKGRFHFSISRGF